MTFELNLILLSINIWIMSDMAQSSGIEKRSTKW